MSATTPFDINGPLEAVHRDTGQVVETRLATDCPQPDSDGDYCVETLLDGYLYFKADGSPAAPYNPWRLRNRAPALPTYNPATHALVPWQGEADLAAALDEWAGLPEEGDGALDRYLQWLANRLGFYRAPPAPPTLRDKLIARGLSPDDADIAIDVFGDAA